MYKLKKRISEEICYTELVYDRIRKKLILNLSNDEIEVFIQNTVMNADKIERIGKNYYCYNNSINTRVTINSNNFRVITADKLQMIAKKKDKKVYRKRKGLNSKETLAYDYMLDGLSLKQIANSTGYQEKTLKRLKRLWFDETGGSRLEINDI